MWLNWPMSWRGSGKILGWCVDELRLLICLKKIKIRTLDYCQGIGQYIGEIIKLSGTANRGPSDTGKAQWLLFTHGPCTCCAAADK